MVHGVEPRREWREAAERVLEHTLMQLVGIDIQSFKDGCESNIINMDAVREYMDLFNANWRDVSRIRHFCAKRVNGRIRPCCETVAVTKSKMKKSVRVMLVPLLSSAADQATKKWCEAPCNCSSTTFVAQCHGLMRTATVP